jgi:hypothetical protein
MTYQPDPLAWGAKVSGVFRTKVRAIAARLGIEPDWLMACMAWESARTFSSSVRCPRSTATGLIQFMEATAEQFGQTCSTLAAMTPEQQLDYVERYFAATMKGHGALRSLSDTYMAILDPVAIGKPEDATLWVSGQSAYAANSGLDADHDHVITKAEAAAAVRRTLAEGRLASNRL